jgi:hypothetical protein
MLRLFLQKLNYEVIFNFNITFFKKAALKNSALFKNILKEVPK